MDKTTDTADLAAGEPMSSPPAPDQSDDALVGAVLAGDEAAFKLLFERHRRRLAHIAGHFFRRREQVEEIVQESFAKVYFSLGDYKGAHEASFITWISRITVNACYDELRRARRRPESPISDLTQDEISWLDSRLHAEGPAADLENTALVRDLTEKLLARLGPEDRMVLTLLNAEDLSAAEIARLMGWSVAKVKVRAHRARAALRRALRKYL